MDLIAYMRKERFKVSDLIIPQEAKKKNKLNPKKVEKRK